MSLQISAAAIFAAQTRQRVTANNVANLNTPGYRSARVSGGTLQQSDAQGPLIPTGRALDAAAGDGAFFQVRRADGSLAYTRDGSFGVNAEGQVVTAQGDRLEPPIEVPANATSVTVTGDGQVYASLPGQLEPQRAGRIEVFSFPNTEGLAAEGANLFSATAASGAARPAAVPVESGFVTGSNVDVATEQVNTIVNTSTVRANVNAFRAQDNVLGELLDLSR